MHRSQQRECAVGPRATSGRLEQSRPERGLVALQQTAVGVCAFLAQEPPVQACPDRGRRPPVQLRGRLREEVEEGAVVVLEAIVRAQGLRDGRAIAAPGREVGGDRQDRVRRGGVEGEPGDVGRVGLAARQRLVCARPCLVDAARRTPPRTVPAAPPPAPRPRRASRRTRPPPAPRSRAAPGAGTRGGPPGSPGAVPERASRVCRGRPRRGRSAARVRWPAGPGRAARWSSPAVPWPYASSRPPWVPMWDSWLRPWHGSPIRSSPTRDRRPLG